MKILWSERAKADLLQIGDYISRNNPTASRKFVHKLVARVKQAQAFPESGRIVPEFNSQDTRELIEGNYRIVYKLEEKSITVLTIFESHQLLE